MSNKSITPQHVQQECRARVSTRASCLTRASHNSVPQQCLRMVPEERRTSVSPKGFLQECHANSAKQECLQECSTKVSCHVRVVWIWVHGLHLVLRIVLGSFCGLANHHIQSETRPKILWWRLASTGTCHKFHRFLGFFCSLLV